MRPADPVACARMRAWSKFVDEYFCPALSMIGWHIMVRRIAKAIDKDEFAQLLQRIPLKEQRDKWATIAGESFTEEQLADSRRRCGVSVQRMEALLAKGPWLAGGEYSLADVNSYSMAAGMPRLMPEHMNDTVSPRSMDWLARMDARPAVKAALAMPNKVPETLRAFGA